MTILEPRPLNAEVWHREAEKFHHSRAIEIGSAGEHIVCADLIMKGHRAFLAAQGLAYDVVVDVGGNLVRIGVKSTTKLIQRPKREGNRVCYSFVVTRSRRLQSGKTDARSYSGMDVDIVALCVLDHFRVAYCHVSECATTMHLDPIGSPAMTMYAGKIPGRDRKTFDNLNFQRALEIHSGRIAPSILRGRRT